MRPPKHSIKATGCPEFVLGGAPHTWLEGGDDLRWSGVWRLRAVSCMMMLDIDACIYDAFIYVP